MLIKVTDNYNWLNKYHNEIKKKKMLGKMSGAIVVITFYSFKIARHPIYGTI